ncbi:hypothetical protein [Acidipropionibacterium acidipropionici]|uniref:hypothetical protein n=1 Tax=Acidipropionibacterium acidipropionici TaxID=1748 RepID=UPI00110A8BAA|nr:hypothetical protein [Acidipropionibacterium acidipropionici]QCV95734.1 hypothetical protein FEZ30_11140 [Acidipropionibacterium acidipropionici]
MSTYPSVMNGGLFLVVFVLVCAVSYALADAWCGRAYRRAYTQNNPGDVSILAESDVTGAINPTPYKEQAMPKDTDAVQLNSDGTMPLTTNRLDDMPEPVFFETLAEARQYVVTALGDFGDDFDVEAITSAVFDFDTATDADGTVNLNRQGFRLAVTTEEFWQIVRDNEGAQR